MSRKLVDLTGCRFGDRVVIRRQSPVGIIPVLWLCRCKCGAQGPVNGVYLRSGRSVACRSCASMAAHAKPLTHDGVTLPMGEWCKRLGLVPSALTRRLERGWELSDALSIRHTGRGPRRAV